MSHLSIERLETEKEAEALYSRYLIISDLDGTLINSKHEISQENLSAISYFIKHGGRFAIATGRSIQNIRPFIKNLELNGPCILYNGAATYDFSDEGILQAEYLKKEQLIEYVQFCLSTFDDMSVEIFTPESMYIISPEKNVDPYVIRENQPFLRASLEQVMKLDWLKLMLYDEHQTLKKAQEAFNKYGLADKFDNVFSHEYYFEVLKTGVSKGTALNGLRNLEHFNNKKIIAVGDYDNDMEMVQNADIGIAVDNARQCVKDVAKLVTKSNDEHVLFEIVHNVIPGL